MSLDGVNKQQMVELFKTLILSERLINVKCSSEIVYEPVTATGGKIMATKQGNTITTFQFTHAPDRTKPTS